jgi:hypothetical protein
MRRPLGNGHAACEHTSPLCLRIVEINLGLPPRRSQIHLLESLPRLRPSLKHMHAFYLGRNKTVTCRPDIPHKIVNSVVHPAVQAPRSFAMNTNSF